MTQPVWGHRTPLSARCRTNRLISNVDLFRIYVADLSLFSATTNSPATDLLDTWSSFRRRRNGSCRQRLDYLPDLPGRCDIQRDHQSGFGQRAAGRVLSGCGAVRDFSHQRVRSHFSRFGSRFNQWGSAWSDGARRRQPAGRLGSPGFFFDFENYRIDLTVVPEPASAVLWAVMFLRHRLSSGDPVSLAGNSRRHTKDRRINNCRSQK